MKFARIHDNTVVEMMNPVSGFSIFQCFHPDVIAQCQNVEDEVQIGWVLQEDGTFAAPVVEETPPAE